MYKAYELNGTLPSEYKKQLKRDMETINKIKEFVTIKSNNLQQLNEIRNSIRNTR